MLRKILNRVWNFRLRKQQQEAPIAPAAPVEPEYTAAGCLFTDGKHILAGYQPHKKSPSLSGFGGNREEGETAFWETAIRETLEELFEPAEKIPMHICWKLYGSLKTKGVIRDKLNNYVILVYDFKDLEMILKFAERHRFSSLVYDKLPRTIPELLSWRKTLIPDFARKPEISHLGLLPLILHPANRNFVSPEFIGDINLFISLGLS